MVLLAAGLLASLAPAACAQGKRPRKLLSKDAYAALKKFNAAERDLIKKKNEKRKTLSKFFEDARKNLREQLIVELNTSLETETKSGNLDEALEWCRDRYSKSYSPSAQSDPTGPQQGKLRVARGGGWKGSNISNRSASRSGNKPDYVGVGFGFRVVRTVDK